MIPFLVAILYKYVAYIKIVFFTNNIVIGTFNAYAQCEETKITTRLTRIKCLEETSVKNIKNTNYSFLIKLSQQRIFNLNIEHSSCHVSLCYKYISK